MTPTKPRRAISVRIAADQRDLIDAAAAARGVSRSEFLLAAACQAAEAVLLDQSFFRLDPTAFRRFLKQLDTPPDDNPGLRDLLRRRPPWA